MEKFENKKLTTARGLDYTYYTTPAHPSSPDSPALPALLFLHGFPDHAHLWDEVIAGITAAEKKHAPDSVPFKMIAPDLLGYGGTSKPTDPALYDYKAQSEDLVAILDAEQVDKAIVIGHDWGSQLAQRVYLHQPSRVAALALLSVAYMPPDVRPDAPPFDLAAANALSERIFGYPQFAYFDFTTSPDAPRVARANLEHAYESMHADEPDWMRILFCEPGAYRKYIEGVHPRNGTASLKPYARKQVWRDRFFERFAAEDSLEAPMRWYVAMATDVHSESTKTIAPELLRIDRPVLYIGSTGDAVCRHEMINFPREKGLLPNLETHVLEAGHWIPMEAPEQVAQHIWGFLDKNFVRASGKS